MKPDDKFKVYETGPVEDTPASGDEDILNYDDVDDPDAFA